MIRLEWMIFMQFLMLIFMLIFMQKLVQMKKQVDDITKEVMNYISYISEEIEEEKRKEYVPKSRNTGKKEQEEAQNRLIQAVLGDFFQ